MYRTKERKKITYQARSIDIFLSLESMPKWANILLSQSSKPYLTFLQWLVDCNFLQGREEKIQMQALSKEFGQANTSKITKWLKEIYEDILDLNFNKPELFVEGGIKQEYYIQKYDNSVNLTMWLPNVPRKYESFEIPFLRGKFGSDYFWVTQVNHIIDNNEYKVSIWLKGGFVNTYREMLLERALFEGHLGLSDDFEKYDFELDKELIKLYK